MNKFLVFLALAFIAIGCSSKSTGNCKVGLASDRGAGGLIFYTKEIDYKDNCKFYFFGQTSYDFVERDLEKCIYVFEVHRDSKVTGFFVIDLTREDRYDLMISEDLRGVEIGRKQ